MFCLNSSDLSITVKPIPCESEEENASSEDEDDILLPNSTSLAVPSDIMDSDEEALQDSEAIMSSHALLERKTFWNTFELGTGAKEIPKWQLPRSKSLLTPIQYFKIFFDDSLLEYIVGQSNLYAQQTNPATPLHLTREELEQFLGTVLFTSVFPLPKTRMYWRTSSRVAQIADVFTRRRWEAVKNFIHFNDNSKMPPTANNQMDKLFKIRPLIDNLLCKFRKIPKEQILCIDEQIVPFKGSSTSGQCNPIKSHKWGYKIFVLSDIRGLVYNFEVYTGQINPLPSHPDLCASSSIVMKLAQVIPENKSHLLYYDSWFSSNRLKCELFQKGIYAMGSIQQNRLKVYKSISEKRYVPSLCEEKEATVDGENCIVKCCDIKCVPNASTISNDEPLRKVEKWDKNTDSVVQVPCPNPTKRYNTFMGDVDPLDGMMLYYRTKMHPKKFYHRLFYHLLDMVVVNCWLLYKRDAQSLQVPKSRQYDILGFRTGIAVSLIKQNKNTSKRRGRSTSEADFVVKKRRGPAASIPAKDVRKDKFAHWPAPCDRQRCKLPGCKKKSTIKCQKCDVHLCLNKSSNCFYDFHTK